MHDAQVRSPLEQLAIPHQFGPRLTLYGAFLGVTAALTQILAGSLIAALWGVRIWLAAVSLHSTVWKSFAILGLSVGMAASLAALVWAVRGAVGRLGRGQVGS